jgi:hypothetical protein
MRRCSRRGAGRWATARRSRARRSACESFLVVHWVGVPKAMRARRTNRITKFGGVAYVLAALKGHPTQKEVSAGTHP